MVPRVGRLSRDARVRSDDRGGQVAGQGAATAGIPRQPAAGAGLSECGLGLGPRGTEKVASLSRTGCVGIDGGSPFAACAVNETGGGGTDERHHQRRDECFDAL